MTPPPDDDPPPPKRRRKPPKGLEDFDTGYPDDDDASVPGSAPIPTAVFDPTSTSTPASIATTPTASISTGTPSPISTTPTVPTDPPHPISTTPTAPTPAPRKPIWSDTSQSVVVSDVPPEPPFEQATAIPMAAAPDPSAFPVFTPPSTSGAWTPPPANLDRDEPPSDLRDAVGAKPKKKKEKEKEKEKRARTEPIDVDDDLDGARPRSRKMIGVAAVSLVFGLGIAALVFLGRANSGWFYLTCDSDQIVAQQGRSFPPWGEATLVGKQWVPIKIPPEAECVPLETENEDELSDHFRAMLVKRASVLLTAKQVTSTTEAKALLEQALLHARSSTDNARNAKAEIQRLLGDVSYWSASLKLRDASKALVEAAKDFDTAAQQRPRHVTDAAAWAEFVRKVVGELESGPSGSSQTVFPPMPPPVGPREPAPPGVALPVEPGEGATEAPQPTPDAGLPTGGVLL